jgi:hypothetical protein
MNRPYNALSALVPRVIRRKVFISYHHGGDQCYYESFTRFFHDQWETVHDNSLERRIDSDDVSYVMQRIRDRNITGTSCTLVLIGAHTHERKYVDWEIKATLEKSHGLLGVVLPSAIRNHSGHVIVPDRLYDNLASGYARCIQWEALNSDILAGGVHTAVNANALQIRNERPMKGRNG